MEKELKIGNYVICEIDDSTFESNFFKENIGRIIHYEEGESHKYIPKGIYEVKFKKEIPSFVRNYFFSDPTQNTLLLHPGEIKYSFKNIKDAETIFSSEKYNI